MLLTNEERNRFADYCTQCADTARRMAAEMEKTRVLPEFIEREKAKAAAYSIVAVDLRGGESMTIG